MAIILSTSQTGTENVAELHKKAMLYQKYVTTDYQQSLFHGLKSLDIYNELHPADDKNKSYLMNEIGLIYQSMGQYEIALKYQLESNDMDKRLYQDSDNPDLSSFLDNIGSIYQSMGKYDLVLKYKLDSYEMMKRLYKESDNPSLSTSLNNIGRLYKSMGKNELALKYQSDSIEMNKRLA